MNYFTKKRDEKNHLQLGLENMEQAVNTLKRYFRRTIDSEEGSVCGDNNSVPQLGFKVSFDEEKSEIRAKVIGARQLPTDFGSSKPRGYLVKVTFYPQKEKFETQIAKNSWPTMNEEFSCHVNIPTKRIDDPLKGKFISFTIYAILGKEEEEEKPTERTKGVLKRYFSFNEVEDVIIRNNNFRRKSSTRRSSYTNSMNSMNNRRTVGAVTYNLDKKLFTQRLRNNVISTPDIWRNIMEITSGIQTQSRDGTKGSIELTLQYAVSEDRKNDVVEISVTKFRCSVQTMQYHEKVGGQLYIKISAFENDDMIQKMKSDKFDPTISLKLEANTATLRATVNSFTLEQVKILIRLISKNILGKKVVLGKIEIDSKSNFWKEIVAQPLVPITKMITFE